MAAVNAHDSVNDWLENDQEWSNILSTVRGQLKFGEGQVRCSVSYRDKLYAGGSSKKADEFRYRADDEDIDDASIRAKVRDIVVKNPGVEFHGGTIEVQWDWVKAQGGQTYITSRTATIVAAHTHAERDRQKMQQQLTRELTRDEKVASFVPELLTSLGAYAAGMAQQQDALTRGFSAQTDFLKTAIEAATSGEAPDGPLGRLLGLGGAVVDAMNADTAEKKAKGAANAIAAADEALGDAGGALKIGPDGYLRRQAEDDEEIEEDDDVDLDAMAAEVDQEDLDNLLDAIEAIWRKRPEFHGHIRKRVMAVAMG